MKKAILVFSVMASGFLAHSQMTMLAKKQSTDVGKVFDGKRSIDLKYVIEGPSDTTYTLVYRNAKYDHLSDYQSVSFVSRSGEAMQLYSMLKQLFADFRRTEKEVNVEFNLGKYESAAGVFKAPLSGDTMIVLFSGAGHFVINEKQLDQLFGK